MKSIQNVFVPLLLCLISGSVVLAAETVSFDQLDANKDGQISIGEASKDSVLADEWSSADTNKDGKIDRVEFSALESLQQQDQSSYEKAPDKAPGAAD